MIYVGIDVGLVHLALVKAEVEEYEIKSIIGLELIDLTRLTHTVVPKSECKLFHTNDAYDRISHFLQEYAGFFTDVDQVRIERQPICGLIHVEQLLFGHFREKAKLISPNAMHKHFGIGHLTYEQRKEKTVIIASPYLKSHHEWSKDTDARLHDMADALCILMYSLHTERENYRRQSINREKIKFGSDTLTVSDYLDTFKFNEVIVDDTVSRTSQLSHHQLTISSKEWLTISDMPIDNTPTSNIPTSNIIN